MRYEDQQLHPRALALGSPGGRRDQHVRGRTDHEPGCTCSIRRRRSTASARRSRSIASSTSKRSPRPRSPVRRDDRRRGVAEQSFKVLGSKPTNVSSININSTVYGASYPALNGKIFRKQGTFRVNVQSGGALGASDAIPMETVDLDLERPQDADVRHGTGLHHRTGDNEFPLPSVKVRVPADEHAERQFRCMAAARRTGASRATGSGAGAFINSTDQLTRKLYQFLQHGAVDSATPAAGRRAGEAAGDLILKKPSAAPSWGCQASRCRSASRGSCRTQWSPSRDRRRVERKDACRLESERRNRHLVDHGRQGCARRRQRDRGTRPAPDARQAPQRSRGRHTKPGNYRRPEGTRDDEAIQDDLFDYVLDGWEGVTSKGQPVKCEWEFIAVARRPAADLRCSMRLG